MAFDLSAVVEQAQKVKESSESSSSNQVKILYPQNGDLKVKLLFNPKSSIVTRKIDRHNINGVKIPCLSMYGQKCPVCEQLSTINNTKGIDLWRLKKATRGLVYAQYIESNYTWEDPKYKPEKGEIVLLMVPWTVYADINRLIAEAGAKADQLVATNVGKLVNITRNQVNEQIKYTTSVDAWTEPYSSCKTDAEFEDMLNNLDSLNDKLQSSTLSDDMVKKAREASEQLYREYLQGQVDQYVQSNNNISNYNQQPQFQQGTNYQSTDDTQQPQQPQFQPQAPNAPECIGKYGQPNTDPNKCLICPYEMTCRG